MFNVNLSVGEFHLVFGSLQDKMLQNEKEMKSLVRTENLYEEVVEDETRYSKLAEENKRIQALLTKLYDETGEQL